MPSRLPGYRGRAASLLERYGIGVGDRITIHSDDEHTGVVMPRYQNTDDSHVSLKLDSGYNVGIPVGGVTGITRHQTRPLPRAEARPPVPNPDLPDILLLSTGGTVASRVDYRTGAVTPTLDAAQLGAAIPELYEMANIRPHMLLSEYSENVTPEHWAQMASYIDAEGSKYDGIVVAHGTDTMHYTSAYLSFALAGFPVPIILTGSQRSSDRASSDAALNLVGAVSAVSGRIPRGVYVAMHRGSSDDIISIHRGTRVRKSHTSSRGAFQSVGEEPPYAVCERRLSGKATTDYYNGSEYVPNLGVSRSAALIKYHPGLDVSILEGLADSACMGVVFEGTGLGHVGREAYGAIKHMRSRGMFVGMASQCGHGRVRMTVYESGRDLLELGVVPLHDMLAETALVKMMWALGNGIPLDVMERPVASEMTV